MEELNNFDEDQEEIQLNRIRDFLYKYPYPTSFLTKSDKIKYFMPIADLGDWLWSDEYEAKELRALYHKYYNIYLGTNMDFLQAINLKELN